MTNVDYLYNPKSAKSFFEKSSFVDKKLGFQIIEHGTILPHIVPENTRPFGMCGIIDKENNFISDSFVLKGKLNYPTPPPNRFNTVPRPSFILGYFYMSGVTL